MWEIKISLRNCRIAILPVIIIVCTGGVKDYRFCMVAFWKLSSYNKLTKTDLQ